MAGMYRTHELNFKNTGTYIGVGDPYTKKSTTYSRHKGRQFQTRPPQEGQTAGYFTTADYSSSNYTVPKSYSKEQPRANRKMGFGSLDARRRDEFTVDIRARQFKEQVKSEQVYIDSELAGAQTQTYGEPEEFLEYTQKPVDPRAFQSTVPRRLYDIGKEHETPNCIKCGRDTFYCPHRAKVHSMDSLRRTGSLPTTYGTLGDFPLDMAKPKYGKVNTVREFYDASHL